MNTPPERDESIFEAALQLPAEERAAYLAQACAGDDQLRQRVEALLLAHEQAGHFMTEPVPPSPGATIQISAESLPVSEKPGDRIGHYKLLEQIGEGGCGVVYMAEQTEPIRRRVAFKVIKLGMDTKQVIARFEAERQALALMDHPNIAKVLDAGAAETGRPYFVMELVKGIKITEFCEQNKLSTKERLDLFIQVCHAIQHAHQKGIIHRDIKPSNVLVTLHDGVPVPKVIDFGIAKATQQPLTDKTVFTAFGQFIGTPAYMSPEQAEMSGLDIDTRTDIYSLGVLLYELLVGKPPFDPETLLKAGLDEMRRIIRETEPPKPSTKLAGEGVPAKHAKDTKGVKEVDRTSLRRLLQEVRGDLDWIVMKCLEKDRTRRYGTANDLASDLDRHMNHEPVTAVAPSVDYLLSRFLRRHRAPVAVAATVTLLLLAGVTISTWQAVRANRAERVAKERAQAETVAKVNAQQAQAAEAKQRASAEYESYVAKIGLAAAKIDSSALTYAAELLDSCPPRLRHWEWGYLRPLCQPELRLFEGHTAGITAVALSPDGKLAATASDDKTARVWEIATGKALAVLRATGKDAGDTMTTLTFLPDSRRLITRSFNAAKVWDAYSGRELRSLAGADLSVSGNGARVFAEESVTGSQLFIRDVETGQGIARLDWDYRDGAIMQACFSADGKRLVTDEMVTLVPDETVSSGAPVDQSKPAPAKVRPPNRTKLWDTDTGKLIAELKHGGGWLSEAVFSPDGKYLFTTRFVSLEGKARSDRGRLWNAITGEEITRLQTGMVNFPVFSPDTKKLLARDWLADKTASIWDLDTGKQLLTITNSASVIPRAFTPDGRLLLGTCGDQTARLWDAATGQEIKTFKGHWQSIQAVAISADGKQILTGSGDKTARLWGVGGSGQRRVLAGGERSPRLTTFSPDGRYVMTSSDDYITRVWDVATGTPVSTINHPGFVRAATFCQDSGRVLTVSQVKDPSGAGYGKRLVRVSEALTGKQLSAVTNANCWLVSPNGRWVAGRIEQTPNFRWAGPIEQTSLSPSEIIRDVEGYQRSNQLALTTFFIWDAATGGQVTALKGHTEGIHSARFSPDSTQIATGGDDNTARVWDTASGRELFSLVHTSRVSQVVFSPDGQRIVTATVPVDVKKELAYSLPIFTRTGTVETNRYYTTKTAVQGAASTIWLWDASMHREIANLGSGNLTCYPEFTADSQQLLLNLGENSVQTFNARTGQALRVFKGHSGIINQDIFFPDGKRLLTGSADRTTKLWDTETGRELLSLPHSAEVTTIAVSADGKRLLTGTSDGTTILWSADDWKEARTATSK